MTSGDFSSFPIDRIHVDRGLRQRKELTEIDDLAGSIERSGLINPIVIQRTGELIAGERRLAAVKALGWKEIPVQFAEDLSPTELHLIELEENICRVDLPWQDECRAIEDYHHLRKQNDRTWSQEDTARSLGKTQAEISQRLGVAKALAEGNEMVLQADKYSVARNVVKRSQDRRASAEIEKILYPEKQAGDAQDVPILNDDFVEWSKTYDGPRFNFIHCDFPYGINADEHNQGASDRFGGYEDTEAIYWSLVDGLAEAMDTVVADQAHLMFWFPMSAYQATFDTLNDMGWRVDPYPLIWSKSDNTGILPDPDRRARRIYETAFMASRGDRKIVQAVGNNVAAPVIKTVHMSEISKSVLRHFFRMFVDGTTRLLDPTCGSGRAVAVANEMGAKSVLGLEIDPEFCRRAQKAYFVAQDPAITTLLGEAGPLGSRAEI